MVKPPARVDVAEAPEATRFPPVIVPVVVMVEAPLLIVPKFEVIEPLSKAPVVTKLDKVVMLATEVVPIAIAGPS